MGRWPMGSANAGTVAPIGTDPTLQGIGVSRTTVYTNAVPPTAQEVYVDPGIVPLFATSVDETWEGAPVYGVDNQTVQLTSGGGQYPLVGVGWYAESTTVIWCKVGPQAVAEAQATLAQLASAAPVARVVLTSLASYTATGGTITGAVVGAIGSQDGLTLTAGQFALLTMSAAAAPADTGLYQVINPGSGSAKFVLERVVQLSGQPIPQRFTVKVGGEGTEWHGSEWTTMCASGLLWDTGNPLLTPRFWKKTVTLGSGTYKIGFGGGGEDLYLWDTTTTPVQLTMNTGAGTLGTNKLGAPSASRVAGVPGTSVIVVNSYVDADTVAGSDSSMVDVLVGPNW
jgi:hypothetical protein